MKRMWSVLDSLKPVIVKNTVYSTVVAGPDLLRVRLAGKQGASRYSQGVVALAKLPNGCNRRQAYNKLLLMLGGHHLRYSCVQL